MLGEVPGFLFQGKTFSGHFQTSSKGTVHTWELRNQVALRLQIKAIFSKSPQHPPDMFLVGYTKHCLFAGHHHCSLHICIYPDGK